MRNFKVRAYTTCIILACVCVYAWCLQEAARSRCAKEAALEQRYFETKPSSRHCLDQTEQINHQPLSRLFAPLLSLLYPRESPTRPEHPDHPSPGTYLGTRWLRPQSSTLVSVKDYPPTGKLCDRNRNQESNIETVIYRTLNVCHARLFWQIHDFIFSQSVGENGVSEISLWGITSQIHWTVYYTVWISSIRYTVCTYLGENIWLF